MMQEWALIIHYAVIVLIVALSCLASGLATGLASKKALKAIDIQPRAKNEITRSAVIGLALIETGAILALITTIIIFRNNTITLATAFAELGIAAAIGFTSFTVSIASTFPVQEACLSIARQPFFSQSILNLMLITQSMIQTAIIFGFLVVWLIIFRFNSITDIYIGLQLMSSGFAIGLGSIGPVIGLGTFAATACKQVSINRKAYGSLIPFVFMSEAIIETPLIFAFLVTLIITLTMHQTDSLMGMLKTVAAALCIGIGTFSPSINSSKTASAACRQIVYNPRNYSMLSQVSMFGQGLIDAAAIYALLIAVLILFFDL